MTEAKMDKQEKAPEPGAETEEKDRTAKIVIEYNLDTSGFRVAHMPKSRLLSYGMIQMALEQIMLNEMVNKTTEELSRIRPQLAALGNLAKGAGLPKIPGKLS
jgi:hypothetical protein